ncbi:2-hydroxyacid dehydrogenase [Streptomyces lonarensis]|uniref:2-hydroxyacid dehydrogenase n=1 Tax=Streptomyces lonarensis TaxID=700599 RepID=A0A7X6HYI7_9ACTN|nr:2-hydroxyacid dehydrogenase [Streptomyces lonarensis]NJQ05656.1 2-hydroxyacid dehydrogenase [Streptomyces lonarensis]
MTTGDAWLPLPIDQLGPLPPSLSYHFWDGDGDYPADPADCVFYGVPYMRPPSVVTAPLPKMTRVRVVQTLTAGYDHMLPSLPSLDASTVLCNAGDLHNTSTAELALTLTLSALRGVPDAVRNQLDGRWQGRVLPSLADRSVLILGYGGIGAAVEERLLPFEPRSVVRVAGSARQAARGPVRAVTELPQLLPDAEVVIVCVPLNDSTRGLVDAAFLARLGDGALLVNVARGAVVDTDALLAETSSGRLLAALDVTDPEPLPADHPLWRSPGVLITPHVGGASSAFLPRAVRMLHGQLSRFAAGEPLRNGVATGG